MTTDEALSHIFNRVSERHAIIKTMEEKKFKFMRENSFMEVHCIDMIERMPDANVSRMAQAFQVTRGAISKVTTRLVEAGAIERVRNPGNRKEIYFRLTELGREIYDEHDAMHRARIERDSGFFKALNEEEKDALARLLDKVYGQIAEELKRLGMENIV